MSRILQSTPSPFDPQARLLAFDELPSTNTWALGTLVGLRNGDVVWTRRQLSGRGRLDRKWCSVSNGSLTFSVVLRDKRLIPFGPNLGQLAACALLETLSEQGVDGRLKWPNDVMVGDRKIAGILVEQAGSDGDFVVGVGLNVNLSGADLAGFALDRPAISLQLATGRRVDEEGVLACLLVAFSRQVSGVMAHGLVQMRDVWERHDWLAGREVRVMGNGQVLEGRYLGIDEAGRLRIRLASGIEEECWTGDVERVLVS